MRNGEREVGHEGWGFGEKFIWGAILRLYTRFERSLYDTISGCATALL